MADDLTVMVRENQVRRLPCIQNDRLNSEWGTLWRHMHWRRQTRAAFSRAVRATTPCALRATDFPHTTRDQAQTCGHAREAGHGEGGGAGSRGAGRVGGRGASRPPRRRHRGAAGALARGRAGRRPQGLPGTEYAILFSHKGHECTCCDSEPSIRRQEGRAPSIGNRHERPALCRQLDAHKPWQFGIVAGLGICG